MPCLFNITQQERDKYNHFVFSFSILNLRHGVSTKFHRFHHFDFHQLFFTLEYDVNLGIESENNKHKLLFMLKSQIFKHRWVIPLSCQISGGSALLSGYGVQFE